MRVCAVQHGGGALESMKNAAGASMSGPGGELDANGLGLFPCGPQDPGPSRSSEDDANIHHQSANGQSRNFFSFRSPFFSPPPLPCLGPYVITIVITILVRVSLVFLVSLSLCFDSPAPHPTPPCPTHWLFSVPSCVVSIVSTEGLARLEDAQLLSSTAASKLYPVLVRRCSFFKKRITISSDSTSVTGFSYWSLI